MRGRLIVGVLCCIVGAVWFTQGIGVLHGSFMTGHGFWTVVGVLLFAVGVSMIVRVARPGNDRAGGPT